MFKRMLVGVVAVIVWGIFTNVVSDKNNFLPNFVNILSNFVFFVVGIVIDKYFRSAPQQEATQARHLAEINDLINPQSATIVSTIIRTSLSICCSMIILNFIVFSFVYSVDNIEARRDASFTLDGYRDIQTYIVGYLGFVLVASLHGYFFFLGSHIKRVPFVGIWIGCILSFGLATLLYILYGLFEPLQINNYISIDIPPAIGDWRPAIVGIICWVLTAAADIAAALALTVTLWLATRVGRLANKREGHQPSRRTSTPQT